MKNHSILALGLCTVAMFTACKYLKSAYPQAYEKARTQEQVTPVATLPVSNDDATPVRTIQGGVTVVNGEPLKAFSVVVGSFVNQTNAEGQMNSLRSRGLAARVVKTNETISGHTGWYRVVASSFDTKGEAVQSRNTLIGMYPGAWILGR